MAHEIATISKTMNGRSLILFTSFESLLNTHMKVKKLVSEPYIHILIQNMESNPSNLIEKFKHTRIPSILMGVDSFWEGMDIKGSALSCVVISKLPFHVPSDPLHLRRIEKSNRMAEMDLKITHYL